MPIVKNSERFELQCINGHEPRCMRQLVAADPVLHVFFCTVCGYVEKYAPTAWLDAAAEKPSG